MTLQLTVKWPLEWLCIYGALQIDFLNITIYITVVVASRSVPSRRA